MQGGLQTRELSRVFRQLSVPVPLAPDTATAGPQAISACQSRSPLGEGILYLAKWRETGPWRPPLWPQAYFSGEMDFSGLPRNSLVKSLVVRRNRWHLYQDSGADSKWRRIYDGRERLAPQLSHPLAPARRTARKQVIPSGVQSFRFGLG